MSVRHQSRCCIWQCK